MDAIAVRPDSLSIQFPNAPVFSNNTQGGNRRWKSLPSTLTNQQAAANATGPIGCDLDKVQPAIEAVSTDAFQSFSSFLELLKKGVIIKQVIVIFTAPLHLINLIRNAISMPNAPTEKKIDTSLDIVDSTRCLGESSGTLVTALSDYRVIPTSAVSWAGPFAIFLSILSLASITKNYRNCRKTTKLSEAIEQADLKHRDNGTITLQSYQAALKIFEQKQKEDADFIKDTFNVDEDKFAEALMSRENLAKKKLASTDANEKAEGTKILEDSLKLLKGRIRKNFFSSALSMVASTINLIGTAILLVFPINPIGWVLVGLGGLIDLSRIVHNYFMQRRFNKALGIG